MGIFDGEHVGSKVGCCVGFNVAQNKYSKTFINQNQKAASMLAPLVTQVRRRTAENPPKEAWRQGREWVH